MSEDSEIVVRNGRLFVLDQWRNDWMRPIKYRAAWPTGLLERDYPYLAGAKAKYFGGGVFRLENGVMVRLEHGEATKMDQVYTEQRAIPKPPEAHEYRGGRWVR
ncbi:MAG: hypothetical protein AB1457_16165 [Chloroflexota bacterium]